MGLNSTNLCSNHLTFQRFHLKNEDFCLFPHILYCVQIFEYLVEKFYIWLNLVESVPYSIWKSLSGQDTQGADVVIPTQRRYHLGCSFPVKCRFVYAISANIFGKADGGGLARQRKQTDISQESYSPVYRLSDLGWITLFLCGQCVASAAAALVTC